MRLRAVLLLAVLIGLCNGTGCAMQPATVPIAPVIMRPAYCPEPPVPVLPPLDGETLLDTPDNIGGLLDRDDTIRHYINALRASINCYAAQVGDL